MPYCIHCGAHLEEGEHCTCPASQGGASQPEAPAAPDPEFTPLDQSPAPGGVENAPRDEQPASHGGQTPPDSGHPPVPPQGGASSGGALGQPSSPGSPGQGQAPYGSPNPPGPGPASGPSPLAAAIKGLPGFFLFYWHSPTQTVASAVERRDWMTALSLVVVQLVAAILAAAAVLLRINRMLSPLFQLAGSVNLGFNLSPALSILWGIVATAVGVALMTLMLFVLARLVKSPATLLDAFVACGANSIPVTLVLLLSFLLGLISLRLGLWLLIMVLPVFAAAGLLSARQLCPQAQGGKFWACYLAGTMLVAGLGWLLFGAIIF